MAVRKNGGYVYLSADQYHSILAEALAHLAFQVSRKAAGLNERERKALAAASLGEALALGVFFDVASDLAVGDVAADFTDILTMVEADTSTTHYLVIDLFDGSVQVQTRGQILGTNALGYVGVAYMPARRKPWVFWNPPSSPLFYPRLFRL